MSSIWRRVQENLTGRGTYQPLEPLSTKRSSPHNIPWRFLSSCVFSFILGIGIALAFASSRRGHVLPLNSDTKILTLDVDRRINDALKEFRTPGGAVAVVRMEKGGGWNVETKGYGRATADGKPFTEKTLFPIGSNTKLFTAMAIGLLTTNESLSPRISYESKLSSIIPNWKLLDSYASAEATITDMLGHRTGLPGHDLMLKTSDSLESIISRIRFLRPVLRFREKWQYNEMMYNVLSVLPKVLLPGQTSLSSYVTSHIIQPLGMSSTTYSYQDARDSGSLSDGFTEDQYGQQRTFALSTLYSTDNKTEHFSFGSGGIISNVKDLAVWTQCLLSRGRHPVTQMTIIPTEVIEYNALPICPSRGSEFPELSTANYAAAQALQSYRGHASIFHGGVIPGYSSMIARFPDLNLGVVVLANNADHDDGLVRSLIYLLVDAVLGLEPIDWPKRYLKREKDEETANPPRQSSPPPPSVPFSSLTGAYYDPAYGEIELCPLKLPGLSSSPSCQAMVHEAATTLPGVIDHPRVSEVPSFLIKWDRYRVSHAMIQHFAEDTFNLTLLDSQPTANPAEPYWVRTLMRGVPLNAQFSFSGSKNASCDCTGFGIALSGNVWIADHGSGGIPGLSGKVTKENSEVWLQRRDPLRSIGNCQCEAPP